VTVSDDLFAQCLREAVTLSGPMMGAMARNAVDLIRARQAAETELPARMDMGDAADALERQVDFLSERFVPILTLALDKAVLPCNVNQAKPAATALRFDQLELMDDAQVQGRIDTARLQQNLALACERELSELDGLVCSARGLAHVQPDRNPLRPPTYSTALVDLLAQAAGSPAQRVLWMQYLGASAGAQLRKVYQKLIDSLQVQQVQAVAYSRGASPVGQTGKRYDLQRSDQQDNAPQRSGANERSAAPRLTVNQLRQVLHSDYFAQQDANEPTLDDVQGDLDELHALVQRLAGGAGGAAQASTPGQPGAKVQTDESKEEHRSDDQVAQDVVRMMVDNLCDDQRLLQAVRDWVGTLEPPLLALVLVDKRFLNDEKHPARQMLDAVTARSLGFSSEAAEGFAEFFAPVQRACTSLQPHDMANVQPFALAWESIQRAWSEQKSAMQIHREQAMQALLQAEQRNLLAEKIALEVTRREDARQAPIFVKQFLAGPWSQVLATARLSSALAHEAQTYLNVIADLLWSAVPEEALRNRQRLVRTIPGMLATLRAGLTTIESPESRDAAFFTQLMHVHEAVLKAKGPAQPADKPQVLDAATRTEASSAPINRQALEKTLERNDEDAVWLAPQEVRDSGFISGYPDDEESSPEDTLPMQYSDEVAPEVPNHLPTHLQPENGSVGDVLVIEPPALGSWVEFLSNGAWVRAQLTWASPHGTLFMFTGAAGNPYSMTRRALDKMQARESMRIITQDSVVVGALNAVAQAALRNSVEAS
jgi:Protein of unknown function (DUF1631)